MIVVKFIGGLGNQMFQYNLFKRIESMGYDVKADLSDFEGYGLHNGFELEEIFDISLPQATKEDLRQCKDYKKNIFSKIRRRVLGYKGSHILQHRFDYELLNKNKFLYLDGYWQAEEYFEENNSGTNRNFRLRKQLDKKNLEVLKDNRDKTLIALHVRRGDYLNPENIKNYAMCGEAYYKDAINYFEKRISNCCFLVFSDDTDWCKDNLKFTSSRIFISWNTGRNSYQDLILMSQCSHNVIANSSFSWWGAFLNENKDKEVIAPSNWWNDPQKEKSIFIPRTWKRKDNA